MTYALCHRAGAGLERVAIPALLATGRVHHHLVRQEKRTRTGLLVETAEAREVRGSGPMVEARDDVWALQTACVPWSTPTASSVYKRRCSRCSKQSRFTSAACGDSGGACRAYGKRAACAGPLSHPMLPKLNLRSD